MKRSNLILVVCALTVMKLATVHAKETIRITNGEWEPYMSQYSPHYGINSHIVSEAFKLEGINVKWGFFPWIRAYRMAKTGKHWDASATWWPTEETDATFLISEPVSNTSFVFFHLKDTKFDWDSIQDLKGLRVGVTLEYDYGRELLKALENEEIGADWVPTDEQNFRKLLAGRIDIFPQDPTVGYAQIRHNLSPEEAKLITHHPKEFEKTTLNLIISRNTPHAHYFLEKFNAGLRKLRNSGRLSEMLKDLDAGKYDKQKTIWKEEEKQIVRISTGDYPPFLSERLAHNGVGLRIIREAFALEGYTVEYGFFPWTRAFYNVKEGLWDASATWAYKESRAKDVLYSDPLYMSVGTFFHHKNLQVDWKVLSDLKSYRIGVTRGYTYTPEFWELSENKTLSVEIHPSDLHNLRLLVAGRIALFPINTDVGFALLNENFTPEEVSNITFHPNPISATPTHLVFSRKLERSKTLVRIFNRGLKRLREEGKIDRYFEQSRQGDYILPR